MKTELCNTKARRREKEAKYGEEIRTPSFENQYKYAEIIYDPEVMKDMWDNSRALYYDPLSNEVKELIDQINIEYLRLSKDKLTERQYNIMKLRADGYTQMEIADMYKCTQSCISRSTYGYTWLNGKHYGGVKKILLAAVEKDTIIQELLQRLKIMLEE